MSTRPNIEVTNTVENLAILGGVITLIIGVTISAVYLNENAKLMSEIRRVGFRLTPKETEDMYVFVLKRILVITIVCTFQILLEVKLYRAAKHNDHRGCQIWLRITFVLVVLSTIWLFIYVRSPEAYGIIILGSVVNLNYNSYQMFVVYLFMRALKNQGQVASPSV